MTTRPRTTTSVARSVRELYSPTPRLLLPPEKPLATPHWLRVSGTSKAPPRPCSVSSPAPGIGDRGNHVLQPSARGGATRPFISTLTMSLVKD